MKRALVCGAGGFIGGHPLTALRTGLVKKLKKEGYWVRGVGIKEHEFAPTAADEFLLLDLREPKNCEAALSLENGHPSTSPSTGSGRRSGQAFDEVYQLAAAVIEVSGKEIHAKHVDGPVGVHSRNFSNARIYSLGWEAKVFLKACPERSRRNGIGYTYPWIEAQVKAQRAGADAAQLRLLGHRICQLGESE